MTVIRPNSITGVTSITALEGDLNFYRSDGVEVARFDNSGRLLVGTSSTSEDTFLRVQGNAASRTATGAISLSRGSLPSSSSSGIGAINFSDNNGNQGAQIIAFADGAWTSGANHRSRLVFSTTADGANTPTERLRIASNGDILLGATARPNGTSVFGSAFTTQTNDRLTLFCATSSTATQKHAIFYNPNGEVGSISTNASATAYTTSSDYRLKENVTAVTNGITRLKQLKPSRFNFIADPDTKVDGFIAHEVQEIVPEAITGTRDEVDEDGNPVYQGIDQSKLVPLLTAALQEAVAKIESLEARLTAAGI